MKWLFVYTTIIYNLNCTKSFTLIECTVHIIKSIIPDVIKNLYYIYYNLFSIQLKN